MDLDFKGTKENWYDTFNTSKERGIRSSGGYIAIMPKPNHYSGQDERYERDLEEYKANAKLIAAAPDLLEALQKMLKAFGDIADSFDEKETKDFAKKAIEKALK